MLHDMIEYIVVCGNMEDKRSIVIHYIRLHYMVDYTLYHVT